MHISRSADSSVLTFILAGGAGKRLAPFTSGRAKPLVSFGGVFCIADFTFSNCVNSGLERAYLLTQYKAKSVRQYIEASSWRTDFVCLPSQPSGSYHGTADSIYKNMDLFCHEKAEYVLVLAADHIYKMDYRKLIRFHIDHGGDATIAAVRYPLQRSRQLGILEVDERGQVIGFEEKPEHPRTTPRDSSTVLASMGVYVFNAAALRRALLRDAGNFAGTHEFGHDIFPNLIRTDRVFAYDFTRNSSPLGAFWRDVGTVDSYYSASMETLFVKFAFDSYEDARWPVYAGGKSVSFRNAGMDSIVAPDAEVSGAHIQQSIVSSSVLVASSAQIHGSVLMRDVRVGKDVSIRRAIVDEGVVIPDGVRIGYDISEDKRRFHVTENGVVAVHAADGFARSAGAHAGRGVHALHS